MTYPSRSVIQQRQVAEAEALGGAWRKQSACQGYPTATFFPPPNPPYATDHGPGLAVCRGCPVLGECRAWGEAAGEIVDGHTLNGQVLGGCVPKVRKVARPPRSTAPCGTRAAYRSHLRAGETCDECLRLTRKTASLRKPCDRCGSEKGYIRETNGQMVVGCASCGKGLYNAPKSETGLPQRSVSDRPAIKPSKRARIVERDNGNCQKCGQSEGVMHIGHLLSVKDGRALGASDEELWHDDNLVLECEECNLGFGERTPSPRLVYRVLQVRMKRRPPEE